LLFGGLLFLLGSCLEIELTLALFFHCRPLELLFLLLGEYGPERSSVGLGLSLFVSELLQVDRNLLQHNFEVLGELVELLHLGILLLLFLFARRLGSLLDEDLPFEGVLRAFKFEALDHDVAALGLEGLLL